MRAIRTFATVSATLMVFSACGSASLDSGIDAGSVGTTGAGASCDSAAVAAALAPGLTFDYDPSESPADLAASTDVVFRAGSITSIEIGEDWSTVFVEDVETFGDSRRDRTPITSFGAFGAGIEDRPSVPASALDGMEVVVFAHVSDGAPGNLVAAIEGFWLQCGDQAPLSVVADLSGEAWSQAIGSLDGIAAATAGEPG